MIVRKYQQGHHSSEIGHKSRNQCSDEVKWAQNNTLYNTIKWYIRAKVVKKSLFVCCRLPWKCLLFLHILNHWISLFLNT